MCPPGQSHAFPYLVLTREAPSRRPRGPVLPRALPEGRRNTVTQAGRVWGFPKLVMCRFRRGVRRVAFTSGSDL